MTKDAQSSILSPFQRFEKLAKALFAVPKKEANQKDRDTDRRKLAKKKRA